MDAMGSATRLEEHLVNSATKKRIPLGGSLELLPLCNMNCDMCYVKLSREEMEAKGRLRSKEEWIALAEEMKEQGVLFLLLTGGEPLLYPGFKELYIHLIQMGMIITINSNGTLIDEGWADFFGTYKPRRINITLYGKDAETYESLCHYKKGFESTLQGIRLLKSRNVDVKLNGSLTKANRMDAQQLVRIAEDLQVPIHIDTYMYPASRERDCGFQEDSRLDAKEAAKAKLEIAKHMLNERYEEYCEHMEVLGNVSAPDNIESSVSCRAGRSSFVITWQGKMMPCVMLSSPQFDVFEEGFVSCWKKMVEAVNKIRISEKCAACARRNVCQTCAACALLETGTYDGVPEYLCTYTEEIMEGIKHGRK